MEADSGCLGHPGFGYYKGPIWAAGDMKQEWRWVHAPRRLPDDVVELRSGSSQLWSVATGEVTALVAELLVPV